MIEERYVMETNSIDSQMSTYDSTFYDSQGFDQNEMSIMVNQMNIMTEALQNGLQQINDAVNGLT